MSSYVCELLLEAKQHLQFFTVRDVIVLIEPSNIPALFHQLFGPHIEANAETDVPDLQELQNIVLITLVSGIDSEEMANFMATIDPAEHQRYLAAVAILAHTLDLTRAANNSVNAAFVKAYVIVKLVDAIWRCATEQGADVDWEK